MDGKEPLEQSSYECCGIGAGGIVSATGIDAFRCRRIQRDPLGTFVARARSCSSQTPERGPAFGLDRSPCRLPGGPSCADAGCDAGGTAGRAAGARPYLVGPKQSRISEPRPPPIVVGRGLRPSRQFSSRRPLRAKFYAHSVREPIEGESRKWGITGPTRPSLPISAMVGKPPNTLGTCLTASGYKRRINVLRLKSACA